MNDTCKHRLMNVGDPIYEWCRQCGILIYQYEDFSAIPLSAISFIDNEIVYNNSKSITIKNKILTPSDIRTDEKHKHDFFVLSATDAWCKICGSLKIKRSLTGRFNLHVKEGILIPQRRISCFEVRKHAGM